MSEAPILTHGSLFSGIGGFDLAAEWMGWENLFHCEINEFCQRVLQFYWPNAITYEDITKTDFGTHRGAIDIVSGGFPCQGFSTAGLRKGVYDHRYLWPEMLRAIRESKPLAVIAENVTGLLTMENPFNVSEEVFFRVESRSVTRFDTEDHYSALYTQQSAMLVEAICQDLEKEGYAVQPLVIPAAGAGAPHRRDRVWIVAYSFGESPASQEQGNGGQKRRNAQRDKSTVLRQGNGEIGAKGIGAIGGNGHAPHPPGIQRNGKPLSKQGESQKPIGGRNSKCDAADPTKQGLPERNGQSKWGSQRSVDTWADFPTVSPICVGNDGISQGLDGITFPKWRRESIVAAGNAIVPQVALEIFKAIGNVISER